MLHVLCVGRVGQKKLFDLSTHSWEWCKSIAAQSHPLEVSLLSSPLETAIQSRQPLWLWLCLVSPPNYTTTPQVSISAHLIKKVWGSRHSVSSPLPTLGITLHTRPRLTTSAIPLRHHWEVFWGKIVTVISIMYLWYLPMRFALPWGVGRTYTWMLPRRHLGNIGRVLVCITQIPWSGTPVNMFFVKKKETNLVRMSHKVLLPILLG